MKNMTLEHIAAVCGGTYIGNEADKKREIKGAVIDSRLVEKDYLFIPVRGEKVDGHSFIPSVFEKGALAVFSERKIRKSGRSIHSRGKHLRCDEEDCSRLPQRSGY